MAYLMAGGQAGMSPVARMLYAAWCGDVACVRELLAEGVPVDATDGKGRTALMLAAARGAVETVALLLEAGADTCARNKGNRGVMDYVEVAAVARLILAHLPGAARVAAATRLLFSVHANPELVACALAAGACADARNKRGDTPLIWLCWEAALSGRGYDCIRLLLAAGARPHVLNCHEHSPMLMALWRDDTVLVQLLLEAGVAPDVVLNSRGERPLHCVCSAPMARVLLAAGADVNAVDAEGYTPLMQARAQDAELIRLLVEAGADVNARNAQGSVLAHLPRRCEEVDRLLYEAGARYCADNMNDVECAVADPNIRWLRMLLEDGADVNRVNEAGQTPLILAAWGARAAAVRVLLGAGAAACIDHCDAEEGVTALHAAVIACRSRVRVCPENIEALLAAGADVNLPDRDGWTPLHSCAFYNLPQLVPLLLRAGADPTCADKRGIKPAEMAREKGHEEVARLLELWCEGAS